MVKLCEAAARLEWKSFFLQGEKLWKKKIGNGKAVIAAQIKNITSTFLDSCIFYYL